MTLLFGFALGIMFTWACVWAALSVSVSRHGNTHTIIFGLDRPFRVNVTRQSWIHGFGYRVSWRAYHGALRAFVWTWARPVPYVPSVPRPHVCRVGELIMAVDRNGGTECPKRARCASTHHGGYDACYIHDDADMLRVAR